MTRAEPTAAIRGLAEDEKLDLLGELWDELEHAGRLPASHKDELDRRLDHASSTFAPWSEVRARVLGCK